MGAMGRVLERNIWLAWRLHKEMSDLPERVAPRDIVESTEELVVALAYYVYDENVTLHQVAGLATRIGIEISRADESYQRAP